MNNKAKEKGSGAQTDHNCLESGEIYVKHYIIFLEIEFKSKSLQPKAGDLTFIHMKEHIVPACCQHY